ncbi:NAD-dependent succinate-semialdehyde dehydrogenase [Rhodococcus sp. 05-2254-5]|uniref:NAD-dependent succinate-semialdehyde dehydrogenase n=1 Tax=unclassified Rhodococcus (in: high G+C Gram-positive bacteria) TaxID=192944 RepID=UPI000B9AD4FC|nr:MULTISPECIES: NAD-dependent succinate-semialdehyde dehydrogenase [unclassified Rhodococcus (in: high G+C Gram-positive bacteria)]OZE32083.1 NAD-dependent succinate-semialdehyde dehydrogenase [Rhodococcus sp. 05-2254-5]OZE59506.1 NAD-dependent succinate-semialdehyde dehydrogenase [Rhodococcus sp. 05-2254-1]
MTTHLSDSRSSQRARATIAAVPTGVFIGGEWAEAASGERFEVIDPASGHVIATVADGGPEDAQRAIVAAGRVQKDWAKTSPRERSELLRRAYELMLLEQEDLALIITSEMGKPIGQARDEVAYAAEFFRWFSEEAVRVAGDVTTTGDGKNRIIVSREPVGPCVLITPWNFPLAMGTRKIGPAIAAGCTVVFKPANLAPLASLALVDILVRVGLPEGVVNVVCTTDASAVVSPWMASGVARKISFTGSTAVGVLLLEQASRHVMRSSMELGGNAPLIVFEDANLDRAVEGAFAAKMRNMGEACTAANRILVQRSVADEFARRLAERLGALSLGDGIDEATEVGPLVDKKALTKVEDLVSDALRRGAKVICGGARPDRPGYFYLPTVLVDVPADADLMFEEIFGPVAAIVPFDSEDEAVRLANDTPWGLAAYLFTQDVDRSFRVGDALEVGMVGLNTGIVSNPAAPFGGVKASGLGREGGRVGIDEFLEYKYMAIPRT